jgi:hypothetical protein
MDGQLSQAGWDDIAEVEKMAAERRRSMGDSAGIVHIAGLPIRFENHLRQRCGWCFAILIDEDLTRIAVPVEQLNANGGFEPATWPIDSLVEVSGDNPKGVGRARTRAERNR